ncbi:MAG: hypothetical protein HOW97_32715 [Catenulispora sp.]|nr:hypothetical protein [Catenulispora sp.]
MSEEQRDQPREETDETGAGGTRGGMGASGEVGRRPTGPGGATEASAAEETAASAGAGKHHVRPAMVGAGSHDAGVTGVTGATAESTHDVVGEGAPRYADDPDDIPAHGSEQSWSAAPHPGYVADPASGSTNRRIAAGTLIGCLALALFVFYAVHVLTSRSSNGFGPAPWTAAVTKDGAVVGGINAQNSDVAPPVKIPPDATYGTGGGQP